MKVLMVHSLIHKRPRLQRRVTAAAKQGEHLTQWSSKLVIIFVSESNLWQNNIDVTRQFLYVTHKVWLFNC